MEVIGIIAEYNPFHNGHLYHINKIKELYPDSLIILVLNGYFLERGNISVLSKEAKTKIALNNHIDIVLELPFVYGTQSADTFAYESIKLLNKFNCTKLVFGSESNDVTLLQDIVNKQNNKEYDELVKTYLDQGLNYPTALAKALKVNEDIFKPNDLLGISYIKAIKETKSNIIPITIKRTNDYHDLNSNDEIISADNIRNKIINNEDISPYLPNDVKPLINTIDQNKLFELLKVKIITEKDLSIYLDVDEGIENRLKKQIVNANSLAEYINLIKTKRYTINKINRMLIHILIGFTKADKYLLETDYLRILGFNEAGKKYIKALKAKETYKNSNVYNYELIASYLYSIITNTNTCEFDQKNKPIN